MKATRKAGRSLFLSALVSLMLLVSVTPSRAATACCLTEYFTVDVLVAAMSAGYTNVQKNLATCNEINISGTLAGVTVVTYDYLMINATDYQLTMTMNTMGNITSAKDTTKDICVIAVEKGSLSAPRSTDGLASFPNPFHGSIRLDFENPSNRADVKIYSATGVKVAEILGVSGSRYTWTPASLEQGIYLVKINNGEKNYSKRVIYLK